MCGIYGSTGDISESQIRSKLERIRFRGPDATAVDLYVENGQHVSFGFNRLAIIDLNRRSDQPFIYGNRVRLVFNGEIYNFRALRNTLSGLGYTFYTEGDAEVICAAYMEFGKNCVDHFVGMFAFVIHDIDASILFGARDRLGKKPLYYSLYNGLFEFASQVSAIQQGNSNLSISRSAIEDYLVWGAVPDPHSIFNEVQKLPPGYSFTFNLDRRELKVEQYWDLDWQRLNRFQGSYSDATAQLEVLLHDAVSDRLFADVPVGVFLSGGIDSSLVAALSCECSQSIETFSVKFQQAGFDESAYARKVADYLGTRHNEISLDYNDGLEFIENMESSFDEPFADSSAIPSLMLAKHTRRHVTVALSGDGGDEIFAGYHRYQWLRHIQTLFLLPQFVRLSLSRVLQVLPHYKLQTLGNVLDKPSVNDAYLAVMTAGRNDWLKNTSRIENVDEIKYLRHEHKNCIERACDFDIKTYLNWDINTKVDRSTMAYSLEARAPLMDHRIVEFAESLPLEFKFDGSNQKKILKEILYKKLPKKYFDRPKSGFTMPFSAWFREELKEYVLDSLSKDVLDSMPGVHCNQAEDLITKHMNYTENNYPAIWRLLVLQQWLKSNSAYTIR